MEEELRRIASALESIAINETTKLAELREISALLRDLVRIERQKL